MLTFPDTSNKLPLAALCSRRKQEGFTLIELLMVFAVIAILIAITFGITQGVRNAQNRAKAKAELVVLSQAIEQFKSRYGDYPWHQSGGSFPAYKGEQEYDKNSMLLYALTGRLVHENNADGDLRSIKIDDSLDNSEVQAKPRFIDVTKFSTVDREGRSPDDPEFTEHEFILDPWGQPYRYWYKWDNNRGAWDVFGFHLYSTGPNGADAHAAIKAEIEDENTGVLNDDFRSVADAEGIIFTGE